MCWSWWTSCGLHSRVMMSDWQKKKKKTRDRLSCDDPPGLVGCLFLFLLCCRRVLLWKRRGSITMRPHTPQRPRAAASINLFSISCALHSAYRLCLWLQAPLPPPPPPLCAAMINCITFIAFSSERETFQSSEINGTVWRCLWSLSIAFLSTNDVSVVQARCAENDKVTWRTFGCERCASQTQIYMISLIGQNQVRAALQGRPSRIESKLPRNSSSNGLGRSHVASVSLSVLPKVLMWLFLIDSLKLISLFDDFMLYIRTFYKQSKQNFLFAPFLFFYF